MLKFTLSLILLATTTTSLSATFEEDLVAAALERTRHTIRYDGSYMSIAYPGGDVPDHMGVCTDVIIRTYRALGTDLQQLIHEDMVANFKAYPSKRLWGLSNPDSNIDHRRVPNLQVFFERNAIKLPVSRHGDDYKPGDIVTWMLPGNLPHIGIVTDKLSTHTGLPLIVHNIGSGPVIEDMLFHYRITAHYHYLPQK
ncbi:MAG: DUF1287 domain-containing protein [Candidatus Thiodiazotropha sp. (ex Lucinoma kastoroae)]|nr:DUF1287 domain-containing protein [Candidatus Thiodiazotropha sp. (ex Lucinoma kastoroae)]